MSSSTDPSRLGLPRELLEAIEAGQAASMGHWISQLLFSSVIEGAFEAALFLGPLAPLHALARALDIAAAEERWALIPPLAALLPSGGAPLKLLLDTDWRGQPAALSALLDRADPAADLYPALHNAALHGCVESLRLLLPRCDPRSHDSSVFRMAVRMGRLDLAELLLPFSDPSARGHQALADAVGEPEILALLIPLCQDPAAFNRAMDRAAQAGDLACARELAPFWRPELDEFSAIRFACARGHSQTLAFLLAERAPPEPLARLFSRLAAQRSGWPKSPSEKHFDHAGCAHLMSSFLEAQAIQAGLPSPTPAPSTRRL